MNGLLRRIQAAVAEGHMEICEHAYDQLVDRMIEFEEVIEGLAKAILLEDYSGARGGPRVLVAQREQNGGVIHVVWELPEESSPNAVLVTAFRPG